MRAVPGRECGECFECCRFIPINDEKLQKPTNVLCPHCALSKGCSVYDIRPDPCRGWECGWKMIPDMPEDFRPEQSGLVFRINEDDVVVVILDPTKKFMSEKFAEIIGGWVQNDVLVYFQTVGPAGHLPSKYLVNHVMKTAVANHDLEAAQLAMMKIYLSASIYHRWEPDGLVLHSSLTKN